jgi:hypothetical protein
MTAVGDRDINAAAAATETNLRAVRLRVSEDTYALLGPQEARQHKSLAEIARIAVEDYLRRQAPKRK